MGAARRASRQQPFSWAERHIRNSRMTIKPIQISTGTVGFANGVHRTCTFSRPLSLGSLMMAYGLPSLSLYCPLHGRLVICIAFSE